MNAVPATVADTATPTVERRRVLESAALRLFNARCRMLADRVRAGVLPFIDAVDLGYESAVWSGLCDLVGDDRVQACMAEVFMGLRR
jgi:hypothetical protein